VTLDCENRNSNIQYSYARTEYPTRQDCYCLPKLNTQIQIFVELGIPVVWRCLTVWSHPWAAWRVSM
jgi:hypothetical protein